MRPNECGRAGAASRAALTRRLHSQQIEFGALSASELAQLSVVNITQRDLFDISKAGRPTLDFGALDQRLVR